MRVARLLSWGATRQGLPIESAIPCCRHLFHLEHFSKHDARQTLWHFPPPKLEKEPWEKLSEVKNVQKCNEVRNFELLLFFNETLNSDKKWILRTIWQNKTFDGATFPYRAIGKFHVKKFWMLQEWWKMGGKQ